MQPEDFVDALIEGRKDRGSRVHEVAAQVLAQIASPDSVPKLLNDTNKSVAKSARKALRIMVINKADEALAEYDAKNKS